MIQPTERFLRAARGEAVDRPPVWLMRQAGRYLPEYRTIQAEHDFVARCTTPALAQEISLQPWRRFGVDGVVVFCDILMPLTAMGLDFAVPTSGPVLAPAVQSLADVARLRRPDASRDYDYLVQTLRGLRHTLGDQAAVIGFCGGPWTVANYMVAGHSANLASARATLLADHALREALYEKLIPMLADYLSAQITAGAHMVQIFDTWAGELTAPQCATVAAPALAQLIDRVRGQTRGSAPLALFCKQCAHLVEVLAATGCDVLSIDADTPFAEARARAGRPLALQGNLSPELLREGPIETIRAATRAMLAAAGTRGTIANLGHGVLKDTPVEHVAAFVETVQGA